MNRRALVNRRFPRPFCPTGRRAQMELIGLVIIVILITLGMLFMAQFALKDDPKKKIFVRKGLAYSTMGALMKTNVDCPEEVKGLTIGKELIEDCANYQDVCEDEFGLPSSYQCGGKSSCCFLRGEIDKLLVQTLGKWNKNYEFKSSLLEFNEPTVLIEIKSREEGCPGERDTSGLFPINTGAGMVENILYLCD